eukprot:867821-Prymnesium_polylepis.1
MPPRAVVNAPTRGRECPPVRSLNAARAVVNAPPCGTERTRARSLNAPRAVVNAPPCGRECTRTRNKAEWGSGAVLAERGSSATVRWCGAGRAGLGCNRAALNAMVRCWPCGAQARSWLAHERAAAHAAPLILQVDAVGLAAKLVATDVTC